MPVVFLERIPLPRLSTYVAFSVACLAAALFHAHQVYTKSDLSTDVTIVEPKRNHSTAVVFPNLPAASVSSSAVKGREFMTDKRSLVSQFLELLYYETWCFWSLINMAYCLLILIGKAIQNMVFGELRVTEHQHVREKFWNFVFYKFIFIFGVLNVQTLEEVLLWVGWFSILGFFHLLTTLTKDRFEFLTFSPSTTRYQHVKLLLLLWSVLLACAVLTGFSLLVGARFSGHLMAFMLAEVALLASFTLHVLVRYMIHLYDQRRVRWPSRSVVTYYTDLVLDLMALTVDFIHHVHMLVWSNILLSMASLVIFMQLRYLYYELSKRIQRHKKYRWLVKLMESKFPLIELTEKETCAICWEVLTTCRQLPCNHTFHDACLRSWLEQDPSCPTCRKLLNPLRSNPSGFRDVTGQAQGDLHDVMPTPGADEQVLPRQRDQGRPRDRRMATTTHFFQFDLSSYFSWLPSFRVEVSEMSGTGAPVDGSVNTRATRSGEHGSHEVDSLMSAAERVHSVFPHVPMSAILGDLRRSGSPEATVDNILEGLVTWTSPHMPTGPMQVHFGSHHGEEEPVYLREVSTSSESVGLHSSAGVQETYSDPVETSSHQLLIDTENSGEASSAQPSLEPPDDLDPTPSCEGSGARFSKSGHERESILESRKRHLVQQARRRFIVKRVAGQRESEGSDS